MKHLQKLSGLAIILFAVAITPFKIIAQIWDAPIPLDIFKEHMMFYGTKHFAKTDIINFLELSGVKFGADLNAYTSFDETVYKMQVPTDSDQLFNKAIMILEDWAHNVADDS